MSSLGKDIVKWASDRPAWQQAALARLARGENFKAEEIVALADQLERGEDVGTEALSDKDISSGGQAGDRVSLLAITDLAGVNALIEGQTLTFGESGITVIYGHNASGKSGYARLVKSMVGALHQEEVLGDVFAKGKRPDQKAEISYLVGDEKCSSTWPKDSVPALRAVHFYDQPCGRTYIETDSELDYRPSALSLLDKLIDVCDAVQAELDRRLNENAGDVGPLPAVPDGTAAAALLNGLSAQTTVAEIDAAGRADADSASRLGELIGEEARLTASDPGREAARLRETAVAIEAIGDQVAMLETRLGDVGLRTAIAERDEAVAASAAAKEASELTFDGEPLAGVGSESWRRMFDAARHYSEHAAYPADEFPVTKHGAHCPLCQQELSRDGAQRLERFDAFVKDTTARAAEVAERTLNTTIGRLEALRADDPALAPMRETLRGRDAELADKVAAFLDSAERRRQAMVASLQIEGGPDIQVLAPTPANELGKLAVALRSEADAVDAEGFRKKLAAVTKEKHELEGRQTLAQHRKTVEQEIARLSARQALSAAKSEVDTKGISHKIGSLTGTYVTSEARDRFTRESEMLNLQKIELRRTRTEKGKVHHKPGLIGADAGGDVQDVLSEGEQTALGLAGYFTEAHFDAGGSALVLDDPVTSLDHLRRKVVAQRLVEFAAERQVIVFSHDLEFVVQLSRAAGRAVVTFNERSIQRRGEAEPGATFESLPWKAKDIPQRLDELGVTLDKLKKNRSELSDEAYEEEVATWAGRLSEAWERILHLELAGQVFDPDGGEVHPKMLKVIARVTDKDEKQFEGAYSDLSEWVRRHDTNPDSNYAAPEIAELEVAMETIKDFFGRVKKYKNN